MRPYKVTFSRKEYITVDVLANGVNDAIAKAEEDLEERWPATFSDYEVDDVKEAKICDPNE